jgi:hypothetical protein
MNLNEISLKTNIKDLKAPRAILHRYGWEVLGTGLNAAVAQHPDKPYVLKLFESDLGYLKFIQFIEANKGNKHLPVINKTVKKIPGTRLSFVRMERLTPITEQDLWKNYLSDMTYIGLLAVKNDLLIAFSTQRNIVDALNARNINTTVLRKVKFDDVWTAFKDKPTASWMDISEKLVDFADSNGIDFLDIHSQNFMLRNNTLVITDPF